MGGKLDDKLHWYKDAIIYELHIKAFRDSNADGIGDFQGLIQKLDYLQDLGVTALWLLPFYPSPLKDDGYDISDYYSINPAYGNIDQFKQFLKEAHDRGLKVIIELVINHTSDQHWWFQRARRAPKDSPFRNFYVWTDDPNQYRDARIIFQDFETSNWAWDPVAQQYYWHRFFFHQPDLNYDNPLVQEEVFRIINYWCSLGVDGFRLDAVPYLFEREGTNCENLPETHAFLKQLRQYVDTHFPGTMLLAEANMWPEEAAAYFGDGDECHMNYHFPLMPRMFMALQSEDRYPITDIYDQTPDIHPICQWAIFLRNHDELTLEMVTDEERDYMYKVYVKDPKARINLGIRHRLAPLVENNRKKIELLNYLLFSLPGTPVLYYGDEIGMGDNVYLGDRDGVRTPMQWNSDRNAGFSEANPHKLYLPVILDPEYHFESVNVNLQSYSTSSLLWWMKRIINKRKQHKSLSRGSMEFLAPENPKILSFIRKYENEIILVIANLSRHAQPAELDLDAYQGYVPVEVFSNTRFPPIRLGVHYFFTLGGHSCMWFLLEETQATIKDETALPMLELDAWEHLMQKEPFEQLREKILPGYIKKMRWFGGKGRKVENIQILDHAVIPTREEHVYLLLIQVNYESRLPETYQLPVGFAREPLVSKLLDTCANGVIAQLKVNYEEGLLYDALFGGAYQEVILRYIGEQRSIPIRGGELKFNGNNLVRDQLQNLEKLKPKVLSGEQSNTSITYSNLFFIKIFRKVDRALNPDVEISRFLSERARFPHVPKFIGTIEWRQGSDTMVLGMIQEMIESSSDAWTYMLGRLDVFTEKILATPDLQFPSTDLKGTLTEPVDYEELPMEIKELIEGTTAELVNLLGVRTGEMHLALASEDELPDFKPEDYSLHYQRSLYAGLQSLVRRAFQDQMRNMNKIPPEIRPEAEEILSMREEILATFRNIYKHKMDTAKIRIHGDYHLGQVLFTGKDFVITDFEGEPALSYSERRLKRSALRDVAGMIRSFHYAAFGSLYLDSHIRPEDFERLIPFVEQWYHYISGFFMKAYMKTVRNTRLVPRSKEDIDILMTTFLLEKAIYELHYELNNRPEWLLIPIRGIKSVLNRNKKDRWPFKPPLQTTR